jgi:hypothetical protein
MIVHGSYLQKGYMGLDAVEKPNLPNISFSKTFAMISASSSVTETDDVARVIQKIP